MRNHASKRGGYASGDIVAGRYELLEALGEGGMGVVWVAHSRALDVNVALKMLRPELAGTDAVDRMAREARAAAQLGNPALVRVLDFDTTDRQEPFIVMELLQGEELLAIFEREGRLTPERAVALILPVLDGLATAHDKGIVHRDIKPENIFIAKDDQGRIQPKVLDFGIAKLANEKISRLTEAGAVVGSPQYLSPEQADGLESIDFHTDIWSVGVVLYELITGHNPFEGRNYNALMRAISRDAPKPITEHGVGDTQLWKILSRCLEKDPKQRWDSLWELGEALALWLFEKGIRVDASSRSLKDAWLEGGITGVRTIVTSMPPPPVYDPDAETLPPPVESPPVSVKKPRRVGLVTTIKRVQSVAPEHRRMISVALAVAAVIAVALFVMLRSPGAEENHAAAPAVSAAPSARAVVPPPAAPEPEIVGSRDEPTKSQKSGSGSVGDRSRSDGKDGKDAKGTASAGTAETKPAAKAGKPARPKKSTVDTEFGF